MCWVTQQCACHGARAARVLSCSCRSCMRARPDRGAAWSRWIAENAGLTEHSVLDYFSQSHMYDHQCVTSQLKLLPVRIDKVCRSCLWSCVFVPQLPLVVRVPQLPVVVRVCAAAACGRVCACLCSPLTLVREPERQEGHSGHRLPGSTTIAWRSYASPPRATHTLLVFAIRWCPSRRYPRRRGTSFWGVNFSSSRKCSARGMTWGKCSRRNGSRATTCRRTAGSSCALRWTG